MKWRDCGGSYRAFYSLGSTCQTAHQLRRLGLRQSSGPLDWFTSHSVPDVVRLIRNRFSGLMDWEALSLLGTADDCFIVQDNRHAVVSYHDFPLSLAIGSWGAAYPEFKKKLERRAARLLTTVRKYPIVFIRTQATMKEAEELLAAIRTLSPLKHRLLIVNNRTGQRDVVEEDWGLDGISSVTVPAGQDWRGSDEAWDTIMKGFRLR